ncbi:MAG TPA: DUF5915 domain-containing protein, partial [Microterricola sp.]
AALSLRKQSGLRVRLPLAKLTVVASATADLAEFAEIVREELNVKAVEFVELAEDSAAAYGITSKLTVNARAAGPRLGKGVQQVIQAARSGDWSELDGVVTAGGVELAAGEYELVLETASGGADQALALLPGGGFVLLDTATTAELESEGLARDVIRAVQDARKAAGLEVSDRIRLAIGVSPEGLAAVQQHAELIAGETLATDVSVGGAAEGAALLQLAGGAAVAIEVEKA